MDRWRIPYELWLRIAPLIPPPEKKHRFGGGRPRVADYQAMNGIFFVLRTGCQWKALDATGICSGSTAHARFQEWRRVGLFERLWVLGLQEYDATKGDRLGMACHGRGDHQGPPRREKKREKSNG